jgi:hypothetical protein
VAAAIASEDQRVQAQTSRDMNENQNIVVEILALLQDQDPGAQVTAALTTNAVATMELASIPTSRPFSAFSDCAARSVALTYTIFSLVTVKLLFSAKNRLSSSLILLTGRIKDARVVYDRKTNQSRGFGFIYFRRVDDAAYARRKCNGVVFFGRKIRVDYSITKRAHTPTPGIYMGRRSRSHSRCR